MPMLSDVVHEPCEICRGARCRECSGLGTLRGYLDTQWELTQRGIAERNLAVARSQLDQAHELVRELASCAAHERPEELGRLARATQLHIEAAIDLTAAAAEEEAAALDAAALGAHGT